MSSYITQAQLRMELAAQELATAREEVLESIRLATVLELGSLSASMQALCDDMDRVLRDHGEVSEVSVL